MVLSRMLSGESEEEHTLSSLLSPRFRRLTLWLLGCSEEVVVLRNASETGVVSPITHDFGSGLQGNYLSWYQFGREALSRRGVACAHFTSHITCLPLLA